MRAACALVVALGACGGAPPAAESPPAELAEERPPEAPPAAEGTIARAELEAVLERGLGRFLQGLSTEPHLEDGRFVGHRVRELRDAIFESVDLQPGDTLLRINGLPIERPEEALAAWSGLRVASELTVDYLREGEARQLRFRIED